MQKTFTRVWTALLCGFLSLTAARAQTTYSPVALTGYNTDVIANFSSSTTPNPAAATTTYDADGSDGLGFAFVAPDYRTSTGGAPTRALPANGTISSLATSGLTFQLAGYGTAAANNNNSLRIPGTNNNVAGSGTLSFVTPAAAAEVYVLAMSGGNAGGSTVDVTLNFAGGGGTQVFSAQTVSDWYGTTGSVAARGFGRVNRSNGSLDAATTTTPRLVQLRLVVSNANLSKLIESIAFNKTSAAGALNVLAVSVRPPCAGTPTAGTTTAGVTNACPSTSIALALSGASTEAGISYQWQRSTDGGLNWNDIGGATSATYSATQSQETRYRNRLTCEASGQQAFSAPVTVGQNPFYNCYCTNTSTGTNEYIRRVAVGTLDNASNANTSGGYADYSANAALTTSLSRGASYQFTLGARVNSSGAQGAVWIDYDHNSAFDASEFLLIGGATGSATDVVLTNTLTIPGGALLGATRMRVRWRNQGISSTEPCVTGTGTWFGETEDYLITIAPSSDCAGTPPATTATASVTATCQATAFTLGLTGVPAGVSGFSYQWQSRPAGSTGAFSNLGSAQTAPGYSVSSQTAATEYQVVVTCTASGQSTTSSPVTVGQNYLTCYCTPTGGNCTNEWIRGVTLNTLSNTGTSCTTGGYADYTGNSALTTTLGQGGSYSLTVDLRINAASSQAGVWIDFDHSGTFDASEYTLLGTGPATGFGTLNTSFTATISVPAGALLGPTRMRVRSNNGSLGSTQACSTGAANYFGEVEDYLITISTSSACSGTPPTVTATSSATGVCAGTGFSLSATGIAAGTTGLSYQWQSRPAGSTGAFSDLGSPQAGPAYSVTGISASTEYQVVMTCTASGQSTTSSSVTVSYNYLTCYCTPTGGNCTNEWIRGVTLNTLSNTGTSCTTGGYADYTGDAALTTSLAQNSSYSLTLDLRINAASSQAGVWIDFDHSGTFDASEYTLLGTGPATGFGTLNTSFTATITVPPTALLGPTRMRVRSNNGGLSGTQACLNGYFGEVEDYYVTITTGSACSGAPVAGTASSTVSTACVGTAFTLTASGFSSGVSGLSFQWESSPAGAGTFTAINGATSTTYSVASQTAATDYRVVVTCAGSGQSAASAPVAVAQTPFMDCYCSPTYASGGNTDGISSVALWPMTNNSGNTNAAPYYRDYAATQTGTSTLAIATLVPGQTANVTLTFGSDNTQYSGVWVDFDQSGSFDAAEYFSLGTNAGAGGTAVIPVVVPSTATLGLTKMRIRGGSDALLQAGQACGAAASAFGEAEDYLVRLSTTPLPVTLRALSARHAGGANVVSWSTASETPNMTFELERRTGGEFRKLATLAGLGRAGTYAYKDLNPAPGLNYYRLRIVEPDGSAEYSTIVTATAGAGTVAVTAFPNPATTELTVHLDGAVTGKASVQLLDLTGKVLQTGQLVEQRATFALDQLPAGVYLVRYRDERTDRTIKVTRQ
jgi:hypothetical protein